MLVRCQRVSGGGVASAVCDECPDDCDELGAVGRCLVAVLAAQYSVYGGQPSVPSCSLRIVAPGLGGSVSLLGRSVSGFGPLVALVRALEQHPHRDLCDVEAGHPYQVLPIVAVERPLSPVRLVLAPVGGTLAFVCLWVVGESAALPDFRRIVTGLRGLVAKPFGASARLAGPLPSVQPRGFQVGSHIRYERLSVGGDPVSFRGNPVAVVGDPVSFVGHGSLPARE